jgi:uncharacterized protein (TIGR03000 family)
MKRFRKFAFAGAAMGAFAVFAIAPGSASAQGLGSSGGGSHGGLFAGHGSSGGGSHGSLFKGHGSSGGSTGGSYMGTPQVAPAMQGMLSMNVTGPAPVAAVPVNVAYLNVTVPDDAKVYLQDQLMTLGGSQRRFVTPQISDGTQLLYTVKVEVVRDGQTITKTAEATVGAGQEVGIAVSFSGQNEKELVASVGLVASR